MVLLWDELHSWLWTCCWKSCSGGTSVFRPSQEKRRTSQVKQEGGWAWSSKAGQVARQCYNPCLDKLLFLERLCIFIYQMLQAEVMENEGEFLALGWSICVGLCNRDAELRIVTELAWSWPETSFKSTWSWLERNSCENSCDLALSCSVFVSTDAKLEEHHVFPMLNH